MAENAQFRVVKDDEPSPTQQAAANVVMMALTALSQRTIVALANLFTLITVGSAFWLALTVSPDPTTYQLVALGLYLGFVIAVNWLVRSK